MLMPNTVGAIAVTIGTERTLFNLSQFTTSRTDSAYCMTSQQPCRYRHCVVRIISSVMGTELLYIQPLS